MPDGALSLRTLVVLFLVSAAALALGACSRGHEIAELRVDNFEFRMLPGGRRIVSGTLHNDGKAPVATAQILISLFDDKNRRVDGMYAVVRDVPAGASVDFEETVQSDLEINGARVKSIVLLD